MGTRSHIYVETDNGYIGTYCQYDGYPEHMLPELERRGYEEVYGLVLRGTCTGGMRAMCRKMVEMAKGTPEVLIDPDCTNENCYVAFIYIVKKDGTVNLRPKGEAKWYTRDMWEFEHDWD